MSDVFEKIVDKTYRQVNGPYGSYVLNVEAVEKYMPLYESVINKIITPYIHLPYKIKTGLYGNEFVKLKLMINRGVEGRLPDRHYAMINVSFTRMGLHISYIGTVHQQFRNIFLFDDPDYFHNFCSTLTKLCDDIK